MGKNVHEGHRKRMLERLAASPDSLRDHELVEIMLFNALPRKNTNDIAHNLLATFGSMSGILSADFNQLLTVEGVGSEIASYLRCFAICMERCRFDVKQLPKQFNFESYSEYLIQRYRGLNNEILEIFSLDSSERIKSTVRFTSSHAGKVLLSMNDISEFITSHKPYGIFIAHNHPFEACTPSKQDDSFTQKAAVICSMHGVRLYDHAVVGTDGIYSYFRNGRLDSIKAKCDFNKILDEGQK